MRCATSLFSIATTSDTDAVASTLSGIPASFDGEQAALIRELRCLQRKVPAGAALLLDAWTPHRFSPPQAECVAQLLALDPHDFQATLADAMHPLAAGGSAAARPDDPSAWPAARGVDRHFHSKTLA
ncbi:hypothetical protein QTH87_13900 [Variovorax sp. J22P168]|uniref:hypothetical protein n=1 Tax=Variovorax jilinensis TaxID=3053513 RepID=UPI0025765F25|nr:hypothetical protein [Variovorax sp. J22P168]MDM0013530.1 hypothetical protein [Variovorax sp. J22P168]